ncbi:hypothetical protein BN2476_750169 [Paraburkholderia piptadeniae]|uniref:Uncharacterized protein n=1 Tax=Paraburkholderia piptadeniae TaxID=1701573 RepID=A0A1N7SS96_9BURK|nr:hypothetical protein BN2476_750169 [Paraburkholderia piptadeniae]
MFTIALPYPCAYHFDASHVDQRSGVDEAAAQIWPIMHVARPSDSGVLQPFQRRGATRRVRAHWSQWAPGPFDPCDLGVSYTGFVREISRTEHCLACVARLICEPTYMGCRRDVQWLSIDPRAGFVYTSFRMGMDTCSI